jgi:hypothetical protein
VLGPLDFTVLLAVECSAAIAGALGDDLSGHGEPAQAAGKARVVGVELPRSGEP